MSECATSISGVKVLSRPIYNDERGGFSKVYDENQLSRAGWVGQVKQVNHSVNLEKGTVRGVHMQLPPYDEYKLVACIRGAVLDVAIDLRDFSSTYGRLVQQELSEENGLALLIPPGCGHAFQTLKDGSELIYVHSQPYVPASEAGVSPVSVGIMWPLDVKNLSERDKKLAPFECKTWSYNP